MIGFILYHATYAKPLWASIMDAQASLLPNSKERVAEIRTRDLTVALALILVGLGNWWWGGQGSESGRGWWWRWVVVVWAAGRGGSGQRVMGVGLCTEFGGD